MVNKVILVGNLGRDPEVRYAPSGKAFAHLNLATSESYKDRDGNKQTKVEWHRVALFDKTAEIAGKYLRKGGKVYIEGRLQTRKWTDNNGVDRYTTEVLADRMEMLGGNSSSEPETPTESQAPNSMPPGPDIEDDDIPF